MRSRQGLFLFTAILFLVNNSLFAADQQSKTAAIVCGKDASTIEKLAAKEIRRYVYLRSDELLPIVEKTRSGKNLIIVGQKDSGVFEGIISDELKKVVSELSAQEYVIKTVTYKGKDAVVIAGGDEVGTLYGAYRFVETMGVRFYMHGDVVADEKIAFAVEQLDIKDSPLFELRGIHPFHDFPEGPDWWDKDGYKAVLGQLPKMRMNFFGLHTYPAGGLGPEPTVWIGPKEDIGKNGRVKSSYTSMSATTHTEIHAWGYKKKDTGDFLFGADQMFEKNRYGASYMRGMMNWPETNQEKNLLFYRVGSLLKDAFDFANMLGIKTCIGTETPLTIPPEVKQRLMDSGKNPEYPKIVQEMYEGMFKRIMETHKLDYYWLWTPETWTWQDKVSDDSAENVMKDIQLAIKAKKNVGADFRLATCGWVLGPVKDRTMFDKAMPKDMPMSCISRNVGFSPVEPGFAIVKGRDKWAIPWFEDDGNLLVPQLWAGRMRKDAADALKYGCNGLMGIHWRTRILGPNSSALAKAGWQQAEWNPDLNLQKQKSKLDSDSDAKAKPAAKEKRFLAADDFYMDWAKTSFGKEAAEDIAKIFISIDGKLPRLSQWVEGPGGIVADKKPWSEVEQAYDFVNQMAALKNRVKGKGNIERFDYWLNNFIYMRELGKGNCLWGEYNSVMEKVKAETDGTKKKDIALKEALPLREELTKQSRLIQKHLLSTVTTSGAMGNVANWNQRSLPRLLIEPEKELAEIIGELPEQVQCKNYKKYEGDIRMFVPVVRTGLEKGEGLNLKVIVLGDRVKKGLLYYREMGTGKFKAVDVKHINRGVYQVRIAGKRLSDIDTIEYYIDMETFGGKKLRWPVTSPEINQTVVMLD